MASSSGASPSFGEHLSFADFTKFVDHRSNREGSPSQKDIADWQKLVHDVMGPAFLAFLSDLRKDGRLEVIHGSEGRSARFMNAWNSFVRDDEADAQKAAWGREIIASIFSHKMIFMASYKASMQIQKGGERDSVCRAAYDDLVEKLNKGNFDCWDLEGDECRITGEHLNTQIDGWKVRQGVIENRKFVPMQPVSAPSILEAAFEVKTGNLLIADWFRIPEFTEVTREGEYERPGINSERGCITQTEHYLKEHGFVSVFVGNTMPRIIDADGALAFGWFDEDYDEETEEDPTKDVKILGSVCTDLWWATIIEKEQLVSIVAKKLGKKAAKQAVEKYLAENKHNYDEVKVEPGTYHLYFAGVPEKFGEKFSSPDLKLHERVDPMFVLSKTRLELVDKTDASPSHKP